MVADKEMSSWDIVRDPNRIVEMDEYGSRLELLICSAHLGGGNRPLLRLRHFVPERLKAATASPGAVNRARPLWVRPNDLVKMVMCRLS